MSGPLIVDQNVLKTSVPLTFAKDRAGLAYMSNGYNRHRLWDGSSDDALLSGIKAPQSPVVAQDTTAGDVSAESEYYCAIKYIDYLGRESELSPGTLVETDNASDHRIDWTTINPSDETDRVRYVDLYRTTAGQVTTYYKVVRLGNHGTIATSADSGGFVTFNIPTGHSLAVGAVIDVTGHSVAGYNTTHTVTAVSSATDIVTSEAYTSSGTGGAFTIDGYLNEDDLDDETLILNEALPVTNEDESVNARRQGMPPSEMAVMAWFQDRMFYAVQRTYSQGTVSTTTDSYIITGSGTEWIEEFGGNDMYPTRPGEWLMQIEGEPKPLRIGAWASGTRLDTLTTSLPTLTQGGASYVLYPDPKIFRNKVLYSEVDEAESVPYDAEVAAANGYDGYLNAVPIQENTGDDDELTALMPYGYALWAVKERHIYRIMFSKQPNIEAGVILVASRGCLNQRCWVYYEGLAYLMDKSGVYTFDGSQAEPISLPIQDLWRDFTIDFTNHVWFHASIDPADETVRFYVQFVGDTGTRPERALCYHVRHKGWWLESYPWEVGGTCKADVGNSERLLVGGQEDTVYVSSEGYTDNGTTISYAWRGGKFPFTPNSEQQSRAIEVAFQPTEATATLNASIYLDNQTSARSFGTDQNIGNGVAITNSGTSIAIDMKRTRSDQGDQPGWVRQEFGGRGGKQTQANRYVSVALSGTAPSTERVTIYSVAIVGVGGQ